MSALPTLEAEEVAAVSSTSIAFDDAFRARLRELLVWRRDVRRFRRDPLPAGASGSSHRTGVPRTLGRAEPALAFRHCRRCRYTCRDPARISRRATPKLSPHRSRERAGRYARLKLAGLEEAPCHMAVFADRSTRQGHGLGRHTMPEMIEYSAVTAVHTIWLAARAQGIGMGWVSILDPKTVATFSTSLQSGNSSAISVSAIRSSTTPCLNSSKWDGKNGGHRRRSSSSVNRALQGCPPNSPAAPPLYQNRANSLALRLLTPDLTLGACSDSGNPRPKTVREAETRAESG